MTRVLQLMTHDSHDNALTCLQNHGFQPILIFIDCLLLLDVFTQSYPLMKPKHSKLSVYHMLNSNET